MNAQQFRSIAAAVLVVAPAAFLFLASPVPEAQAAGASLKFSPSQGEYFVNSTFDVSIVLDTGGQAVNAVEVSVSFPADKLQVVSPSVGRSFIEIWTASPNYSNSEGTISFQGGLPSPGITTSSGVVSTIQFRAKSSGKAVLKFLANSKVLANDGQGENILSSVAQSIHTYTLKLAPPAGPIVSSPTHENQNKWYNNQSITWQWEAPSEANGYSYVIDNSPTTTPPETVTTTETQASQTLSTDGLWYFHLRARNKEGGWGGTTHFLTRIDTAPPAAFKPQVDKTIFDTTTRPVATFGTTDAASGIDHYETKIINQNQNHDIVTLFTEQTSPYQLPVLGPGKYTLIVKAYDAAGNTIDGDTDLTVVGGTAAFGIGRPLFANPLVTNIVIVLLGLLLLLSLAFWLRRYRRSQVARRFQEDMTTLQKEVAAKQAQLNTLTNLRQQSEVPLPTPPPNPEAPRFTPKL